MSMDCAAPLFIPIKMMRRRLVHYVTMCWSLIILGRATAFTIPLCLSQHPTSNMGCCSVALGASVATAEQSTESSSLGQDVLKTMELLRDESNEYADMFGLSPADAAFYALFKSIRTTPVPLGLKGDPFVLKHQEIVNALQQDTTWPGFFTMADLERAVNDDFLDAKLGSTDARSGWKIKEVSQPRGQSFEEARMTFEDVQAALEKGTVIFNAAGAHIPKLAGPSLACSDGTHLPCALNLYVTDKNKRTSAPPHTDKQDVMVVQTSGRKHWRVYSPPNPALKPSADMFARGKGVDSLPLHALESEWGCQLLLETILNPGDALFIPAGFPHTTSTAIAGDDDTSLDETSIHLTLGIDHHIWELDYLNARRMGLRRAGVVDTALGQVNDDVNPFEGRVNELPSYIFKDLMAELPLGLLEVDEKATRFIDEVAAELQRLNHAIDADMLVEHSVWKETAERFRQEGLELLDIHRDMYLAAMEEGQKRQAEDAMTAHLATPRRMLSPERMQRLSLFRVKRYYDCINESKARLKAWSYEGKPAVAGGLAVDWAYTVSVNVGDQVEALLGGALFPATVTKATGGLYDVQFFDGDRESGLERSMIRLLETPVSKQSADIEPSNMTAKQLKRWRKQQDRLKTK